jgi:sec-independent protein translocase protein TatA
MTLPRGWELILILVIVLLLFGPGRISKLAGDIGKSIRAFREGIGTRDEDKDQTTDTNGNIDPK